MRAAVYAMGPVLAAFIALSGCLASLTGTDAQRDEEAEFQRYEIPYARFRLYDMNGTLVYKSREPGEERGASCTNLLSGNYTATGENSTAAPGHRIVSYRWSGPDGFAANGSRTVIPIPVGDAQVSLTITDDTGASTGAGGCFSSRFTWTHNASVEGTLMASVNGTSLSERNVHNFAIDDKGAPNFLVTRNITITLTPKTGTADLSLTLLDADGTKLADADAGGIGAVEQITMDWLRPGNYSLVVEGTALNAEYTLAWSMIHVLG